MELTPVENRNGMLYKREDLYQGDFGVNGAKYRACQHLVGQAYAAGARRVVSAASVLSPQSAMASVVAREYGMECTVIVGGTTPEKAVRHKSIAIAAACGAEIKSIGVGYNPALQKAGAVEAGLDVEGWQLPYGITTPPGASPEEIEAFLRVGSPQTMNLPDSVRTLVVPFGSGNTAAGVLYGLGDFAPAELEKVVLVGIGPDRYSWLETRLSKVLNRQLVPAGVTLEHVSLHGWFADYGDVMRETQDDIIMHPTYEGKVVRFLNMTEPGWWTERDGHTALWVVGGPLS